MFNFLLPQFFELQVNFYHLSTNMQIKFQQKGNPNTNLVIL